MDTWKVQVCCLPTSSLPSSSSRLLVIKVLAACLFASETHDYVNYLSTCLSMNLIQILTLQLLFRHFAAGEMLMRSKIKTRKRNRISRCRPSDQFELCFQTLPVCLYIWIIHGKSCAAKVASQAC